MADDDTEPSAKPGAQATALWRRLDGRQRVVVIGALVLLLGVLGWVIARDTGDKHALLFSGLAPDAAGRVVLELQTRKIPYKIENNGTAITVPEDQVHELRLTLSAEGASPVGAATGFELFDKQAFGTTSFVERLNFRRALEGELSRTIVSLATVDRARVHIAMGKRSLYTREDEPPSASVVLALRAAQQLSASQKRGIVNLVAASVDGLTPERVTLVDNDGNALTTPGDEQTGLGTGAQEIERTLATRVERMLGAVVGIENVAVTVTAEIDRQHVEQTENTYDQSPENTALRSESRQQRGDSGIGNAGGPAGARGNLPGTEGTAAAAAGTGASQLFETKNYEVNHIIRKTIGPKRRLKRLHLAVLVDELLDEDGNPIVRTAEEIARLTAIAREAAGMDEERGDKLELHSVAFARKAELDPLQDEAEDAAPAPAFPMEYMVAAGAAAFMLFIVFFVFLRRRRQASEPEDTATLPMTVRELEAEYSGTAARTGDTGPAGRPVAVPSDAAPLERASSAAASDTELAARVLRAWLAGDSATAPAANDEEYDEAA